MTHKQLLGRILIGVGEQLCDPESRLSREVRVSEDQLFAITRFARILLSPSVQVMYLADLCERWNKAPKTIKNWVDVGLVRRGHKRRGDTRLFWYASEVDEDTRVLERMGYVKSRKGGVMRALERCRMFLRFGDEC